MKPSLNSVILGGGLSFEEQVALASRHGFLGLDTGIDAIAQVIAEKSLDGAKEFFASYNVQPACWGLTANWQASEADFQAGLAGLPAHAKTAQEIGCTRCLMWISPSTDDDPVELRKVAVARFGECAKVLNDYGCRLGLEWVGPKTSRTQKHDFVYRIEHVLDMEADMGQPNLGLLVDSFHWFTAHQTAADLEALTAAQVVHVHLNDAPDKPRDEQMDMERLLPGEGVIDLKAFLGALKKIGYPDYMGTETFSKVLPTLPPDESAAKAKAAVDKVMALI